MGTATHTDPASDDGAPGSTPLERARWAAFHASPGQVLAELADSDDGPERRWLLGVALGALGRYGEALAALEPLLDEAAAAVAPAAISSLTASTAASLLRQLGDYARAETLDQAGLARLPDPTGEPADVEPADVVEARADALIGLVADAVGAGRADEAAARLQTAADYVAGVAGLAERHWRPRVRLGWVRAEVALLRYDDGTAKDEAAAAAREAVREAERADAPRHLAKSLLFLGVAIAASDPPAAAAALQRAAELADQLGARPLSWPSYAVLADVLTPTGLAVGSPARRRASEIVREIAAELPDELRARWLAAPDRRRLYDQG